jgi:hydrogenase-4 component B
MLPTDFSAPGLDLLVAAGCLLAASGVPGLLLGWRSLWGPRIAALLTLLGAIIGIAGAVLALLGGSTAVLSFPSPIPDQRAALGCDPLSAIFLLPLFLVGALGSVYGLSYWCPAQHPRNGRRLRLCFGLLLASMTFLLLARDGITFLVAWEAMALCGYFLVGTEERAEGARAASWLYLVYSHAGTLSLFGFFALLAHQGDGFAFRALEPGSVGAGAALGLFAFALVGFGIKAGVMPFHSWLPAAHAAAPSHVSAVMSGVMIKMGIYGLFRTAWLLPPPPASWGALYFVLGSLSCVLAIAFALGQRDIKRLLAYSSIENIGIILLGLGLAQLGRALDRPDWVLLGLAGALLHAVNHSLFKSLLFMGAGSIVHATGSRDLERAGGLARSMPATTTLFLLGALAISGLPPLNGFVSELLVYIGLTRAATSSHAAWVAFPAPVLAATGALAIACFVRVFGLVFLGAPRSSAAAKAHESPPLMLGPMAILAAGCVAIGTVPALLAPALERVVASWPGATWSEGASGPSLDELAPLGLITAIAAAIITTSGALVGAVTLASVRGRMRHPHLVTWDCGYASSSPRLQYTASSFAQIITMRFAWALRPVLHAPDSLELFPAQQDFRSQVDDSVLERVVRPAVLRISSAAYRLRAYQQGNLHRYVLYIVLAVGFLLLFNLRLGWLFAEISGP